MRSIFAIFFIVQEIENPRIVPSPTNNESVSFSSNSHNSFMGDSTPAATATAAAAVDEEQRSGPMPQAAAPTTNHVEPQKVSESISSIMRRWKLEEMKKKSGLILRAVAFAFSFLCFVIMASNKHGGWMDFNHYEEYRYCLSIALLACFYTISQVARQIHQILTGKEIIPRPNIFYVDFAGDQITAYLLLSASSAAVPSTDRMRENNDNAFTDMTSASISMAFFAFASLAASSLVSGFKLARHTYI